MTNEVEPLFMCLLVICVSSPEERLFKSFAHFKIVTCLFYCSKIWVKNCVRVLHVFSILGSYQIYDSQNFSLSCGLSFLSGECPLKHKSFKSLSSPAYRCFPLVPVMEEPFRAFSILTQMEIPEGRWTRLHFQTVADLRSPAVSLRQGHAQDWEPRTPSEMHSSQALNAL